MQHFYGNKKHPCPLAFLKIHPCYCVGLGLILSTDLIAFSCRLKFIIPLGVGNNKINSKIGALKQTHLGNRPLLVPKFHFYSFLLKLQGRYSLTLIMAIVYRHTRNEGPSKSLCRNETKNTQ